MIKNNKIRCLIDQYLDEYGIFGLLNHIYEKFCWIVSSKKFKKVGKHTFVQKPYQFHGEKYISIGNNFNARKRLQLEAFDMHNGVFFHPEIVIGNRVSLNYDVHIGAINKIIIEDDVLIASKVFITDHSHGQTSGEDVLIPPQKRILYSKGPVHIKERAWIGEGVVVMPNVTIGRNSIVGANSVVTKDVPDNCIVAGNPAKILRQL